MRQLSHFINRISILPVMLAGCVLFAVFIVLLLPAQSRESAEYTSSRGSPDMKFFYTPRELEELAQSYSPEARGAYMKARFTFDLIWPLGYTFFMVTWISFFLTRRLKEGSPFFFLNLLPLLGSLLDYLENLTAGFFVGLYPRGPGWAAYIAPFMTTGKWIVISLGFILLAAAPVIFIIGKIRRW